jgi:hypothetical protein
MDFIVGMTEEEWSLEVFQAGWTVIRYIPEPAVGTITQRYPVREKKTGANQKKALMPEGNRALLKKCQAGSVGFNGYRSAVVASLAEGNDAFSCGKQGVILADANIGTGMEFGAALTNDNVAGPNQFTTKPFDAEAFRFRIATVFC